jgi:hypothetical protein
MAAPVRTERSRGRQQRRGQTYSCTVTMALPLLAAAAVFVAVPSAASTSLDGGGAPREEHEASLLASHHHRRGGAAPSDSEPTIPSLEETLAAGAAWEARMADADEWDDRLREVASLSARAVPPQRRRTQADGSSEAAGNVAVYADPLRYNLSALSGSAAGQLPALGGGGRGCEDPRGTNFQTAGPDDICLYDCDALQDFYFPGDDDEVVRCFAASAAGEWPTELLGMRQTKLDWHTYLAPTPVPADENFTVGGGDQCVNVTIQTVQLQQPDDDADDDAVAVSSAHTEVRCLVQGQHEHNHTTDGPHTVDVVGFVRSGLHSGSGGVTSFVVGECTDVLIRVNTTSSVSGDVAWQINDDYHNGPWDFVSPSGVGVWERVSCMFDNHFTIRRNDSENDGWRGTIAVHSYVPDNTIDIPVSESWIIQGTAVDGVPVILPARLKSGYAYPYPGRMSQANLVIRYVRFSAQRATLDRYEQERTHSIAPPARLGGALDYTGGWGATIRIEHCVFDHLHATSGGALFIDGQMDEWARQAPQRTKEEIDRELTVTLIISDTLFWECEAVWAGAAARLVDVYPLNLTMVDNQFLDNYAIVSVSAMPCCRITLHVLSRTFSLARTRCVACPAGIAQNPAIKPSNPSSATNTLFVCLCACFATDRISTGPHTLAFSTKTATDPG